MLLDLVAVSSTHNKFSGNNYKWYQTKEQAEASYLKHLAGERRNRNMKTIVIPFVLIVATFLVYVIVLRWLARLVLLACNYFFLRNGVFPASASIDAHNRFIKSV
jgi:hypothetical protein